MHIIIVYDASFTTRHQRKNNNKINYITILYHILSIITQGYVLFTMHFSITCDEIVKVIKNWS